MVSERSKERDIAEPVFGEACAALLEYVRKELVPNVVSAADTIKLSYPGMEGEFRLGLYIYNIEEVRPNGPSLPVRIENEGRRQPDLKLALRIMAFVNRKAAFNSMTSEEELLLLEGIFRAVYASSNLEFKGGVLKMSLDNFTNHEKVSLWQSLSKPIQPAVYFSLEPLLVPGTRIVKIPKVREVELITKRKDRGGV